LHAVCCGNRSVFSAGKPKYDSAPDWGEAAALIAFRLRRLLNNQPSPPFSTARQRRSIGLSQEQRRLIELLKEKRQAVISHAVTKGLNPHARMKPSASIGSAKCPTLGGKARRHACQIDNTLREQLTNKQEWILLVNIPITVRLGFSVG